MNESAANRAQQFRQRLDKGRSLALVFTIATIGVATVLTAFSVDQLGAESLGLHPYQFTAFVVALPGLLCVVLWWRHASNKQIFSEYTQTYNELARTLQMSDLEHLEETVATAQTRAQRNALVQAAIDLQRSALDDHSTQLTRSRLRNQLEKSVRRAKSDCATHLDKVKQKIPLLKTKASIESQLVRLRQRRNEIAQQWNAAYEKMSWADKLWYGGNPDFREIDKITASLDFSLRTLQLEHSADFKKLSDYLSDMARRAHARITEAQQATEEYISQYGQRNTETDTWLKTSLVLSAISLPISVWTDIGRAGEVYEALRRANGRFAGLSDSEIWLQTLFMPAEQFAGLASLTKGAYLEKLVAKDTRGTLFEHFNNPNTDIVIDGVAYQIKATDSVSYIGTVVDGIPVIATTEVASKTGAIDAGYTNAELDQAVDLALGGSIIDVGDTVTDAIMSGVGGLGLMATARGINHAAEKIERGVDTVEAALDGLEVAIGGTARTLVNTAELGYKVLSSKPSRFIGRTLLKGLQKLDEKITSP